MRIAIVKPILPWPANQGTKRVTVALLEALASEHDVTLFSPFQNPGEVQAVRDLATRTGVTVIATLSPNRRSAFHRLFYKAAYLLRSFLGGHSPRALYASPPALIEQAARASREPFDLAIFEYWYTYPWFAHLAARRRVLLAHDAEFSVNRLAAKGGSGERSRWARNEAGREVEACRAADQVWTLTEADGDALADASKLPRSHFVTMPFGVETERLRVLEPASGTDVLFFGAFAADFNRDALQYLLESIWPLIRRERPAARLVVAGGGLPDLLRASVLEAGGIVKGEIADVRELYASAAVVAIPLRFGGGLRIRLLEALAASRAVVATPVAVHGIPAGPEVPWRVAATADDFARAVRDLLDSPEERARLGEAGRRLVLASWSAAGATREIRRMAARAAGEGAAN